MRSEGELDRLVARGGPGERAERGRIAVEPERGARLVELAGAEQRGGRGPGLAVAVAPVGRNLRAERDQVGQVGDGLDLFERCDADEPVRVEVVAEQDRRVEIGRSEEAGTAEVEEVALVDRLEPEREARLGERREDRLELTLVVGAQRGGPERALPPRPPRRSSPRAQLPKNSATASTVRSISGSPWASETNIASNCEGAT